MQELLTQLAHYSGRFFGFFRLAPLSPLEQDDVRSILAPAEAELFWQLQPEDQRHSYEMARRVRDRLPDDGVAVAASLLHDVGKRQSRLGPFSRSVATVLGHLGFPMTTAMRSYWDHGAVGARDLEAIGSDPFVVAFAAGHGASGARGATDDRWDVLDAADW